MANGLFNLKQQLQGLIRGAWSGTTSSNAPKYLEYLVVAGGGAGGTNQDSGGGGAGGLLQGLLPITLGTSYTVTVGAGGTTSNGSNSVLGNITALGGGYGGLLNGNGNSGGSGGGGGGSSSSTTGGQGTAGQGNAGGSGAATFPSGGGGGAGTVGLNANNSSKYSGNGGAGIASSISGTLTTYAGGGGGGGYAGGTNVGYNSGGVGGGGNGYMGSSTGGTSGGANTGGGGGGNGDSYGSVAGSGGSGIVIVRYAGITQYFSGGTLSFDSVNNYVVHTFYVSGTLAPLATPTTYANFSYAITKSLRFRSGNNAYLSRTPATTTNRQTWTWSAWIKRGSLASSGVIFEAAVDSNDRTTFYLAGPQGYLTCQQFTSGSADFQFSTTPIYQDTSAWYHFVIVANTTNPTQANRLQIYVNNVLQSVSGTFLNQNLNTYVNGNNVHYIGKYIGNAIYLDAYMAEINFIDGQALTPQSFGAYSPTTGVWQPISFVGSYGTNGFYLPFTNTTSTTTLGYDSSGNSNNFATSGFSLTTGSTYDSMPDSPTLTSASNCNWAVINPNANPGPTFSNGNLTQSGSSGGSQYVPCSIGMTSGQFYCEMTCVAVGAEFTVGICSDQGAPNYVGQGATSWGYYTNGYKYHNGSGSSYGASWGAGDVIGIAFDATGGNLTFYKNGTSQGVAYTGLTSGPYFFTMSTRTTGGTATGNANFGQQAWTYTPPSGYVGLNIYSLSTPTIPNGAKYMNVSLYPGNNGTQAIINAAQFQPDIVWAKNRTTGSTNHRIFDSNRGASKVLYPNSTQVEDTVAAGLTSFNVNGFSIGSASINDQGSNFVAWQWQAGLGNNTTNTNGSITSTVNASATTGISIVTYTGNATNSTVGHGLGVAPSMIIFKSRSASGDNWLVYHSALGATNTIYLNLTNAASSTTAFNNTAPTSTVFSLGSTSGDNNSTSTNYVAYCFAQIAGFSAFGSYTGNGSASGPFIYCGFQPKYVMMKRTDNGTNSWFIWDTVRYPYNTNGGYLLANTADAENAYTAVNMLSNGFQLATSVTDLNVGGGTYIYMAFASNPFKYANAF